MEQSSGKETTPRRGSLFSLGKSLSSTFTGSSPNLQQSPTPGQGIASPSSDMGNRRLSGSAMLSIDENASDAGGTDSGATPTKKKSKVFSTKFVKKMFRSNSMSSANGGDDIASVGQPDDALGVLESTEGVDESRQSEYSVGTANDADAATDDGTTPKKKKSKVFSTKFVKKIFRSNSMTSTGAPETPGSADGNALDTPGEEGSVAGRSMKQKRKSFFSFGGRSSFSGAEGKASAPPSVTSTPATTVRKQPAADTVYAGPVSPSFTAPKPEDLVYEDDDGEEEEEQVIRVDTNFQMKQSFFDSPAPAAAPTAATGTASTAPVSARPVASTTSPGSAKLLFGSVDDEPPLEISSPLPRLDYDLPMHSPSDAGTGGATQESESEDDWRLDNDLTAPVPAASDMGSVAQGIPGPKPAPTKVQWTSPPKPAAETSATKVQGKAISSSSSSSPKPAPRFIQLSPASPSPTLSSPTQSGSASAAGITPLPPQQAEQAARQEAEDLAAASATPPPPPPPTTPGGSSITAADDTSSVSGKPKRSAFYSAVKSVTKAIRRASFGNPSSAPSSTENAIPFAHSPTSGAFNHAQSIDLDLPEETAPPPPPAAPASAEEEGRAVSPKRREAKDATGAKITSPGDYRYGTATMATFPIPSMPESTSETTHVPPAALLAPVRNAGAVSVDNDDPSVLKVSAPGYSESELAELLVPSRPNQPILQLVLRGNSICSPERFCFGQRFEHLADLDLSYNSICGAVKGLPATLLRLDLSHNRITNVSNLLQCVDLVDLNLAHNDIKSFHGLPPKLEKLDLSRNVISSIITIRMLGLSPNIKSINVTGNPVTLEVKEWRIVLCTVLTQLVELNGRPLPKPKKATAPPAIGGAPGKRSPAKNRPSATVREEQRVNDAVRTKMHQLKMDMLKESQEVLQRGMTVKAKSLRPEEMSKLSQRLAAPTQSLKLKQTSAPTPPPLFSNADLHRRTASFGSKATTTGYLPSAAPGATHHHGRRSGNSAHSGDTELSAWLNKSKAALEKAAHCVARALKMANQEHPASDELTLLSDMISRLDLVHCRDPPLKVESAIERLSDGDAMKRRVATVREHLHVLTLLTQQVDSAVVLSAQGVFQLREALDTALSSGPGLLAHTSVLRACDPSFDTSLLVHRPSPQRSTAIRRLPATNSFSQSSALSSSRSLFDSHDDGAPNAQAVSKANDRGFAETKAAVEQSTPPPSSRAPSMTPEAFMDRVRSRITMRTLYGRDASLPTADGEEGDALSTVRVGGATSVTGQSPARGTLDFTAAAPAKAEPLPPPMNVPNESGAKSDPTAAAPTEPQDPKSIAKQRVLARMRTASRTKLDEEATEAQSAPIAAPASSTASEPASDVSPPPPPPSSTPPSAPAMEFKPEATTTSSTVSSSAPPPPAETRSVPSEVAPQTTTLTYSAESVDAEEPLFAGLTEDVLVPDSQLDAAGEGLADYTHPAAESNAEYGYQSGYGDYDHQQYGKAYGHGNGYGGEGDYQQSSDRTHYEQAPYTAQPESGYEYGQYGASAYDQGGADYGESGETYGAYGTETYDTQYGATGEYAQNQQYYAEQPASYEGGYGGYQEGYGDEQYAHDGYYGSTAAAARDGYPTAGHILAGNDAADDSTQSETQPFHDEAAHGHSAAAGAEEAHATPPASSTYPAPQPQAEQAQPAAPLPVQEPVKEAAAFAPIRTPTPEPAPSTAGSGLASLPTGGSQGNNTPRDGTDTPNSAAGAEGEGKLSAKERLLARMAKNKKG